MKTMKKMLAGFLVVAMLVSGLMITPMDVSASETVVNGENGVIFVLDAEKYNFTNLWETKTAPVRADYVFGGWYTRGTDDTFTAIKESEGSQYTEAYAKFVPAEVLSVRAQLEKATETGKGNTDKTYLRLLSGVNELDYQYVGFDILYNKTIPQDNSPKITKVYKTITNSETAENGVATPVAASSVFGAAATHFSVLRIADIYKVNYEYVIYVNPYWITLDGTRVDGQAKYLRVMDGYADNYYISVPVNFLAGSSVAAGQMTLSYDSDRLEVVKVEGLDRAGFDAGVLMPEMSYYDDEAGTIKIVGNISGNTDVEPETEIYANVWFKEKSTLDKGTELNFTMGGYSFCNWKEEMVVDVSAWNFKYLK